MELRKGTNRARHLRETATDAEAKLWGYLRSRRLSGFKFRRQFPIASYIVDFVCLDAALIVEVDGSQHAERAMYDANRSEILIKNGFRVLRFWNNDVLQKLDGVLTEILQHLEAPPSPQPLSRQRERS